MPELVLPSWTKALAEMYESGAATQFVLHGNVLDSFPLPGRKTYEAANLAQFLERGLLGPFEVILTYDLGDGLRVIKGGDSFRSWPSFAREQNLPKPPREAFSVITHYLRYVANLQRMGEKAPSVAVIIHNAELVLPSSRGLPGYDLAAMALQTRDWAQNFTVKQHSIATFLITETLSDLHHVTTADNRTALVEVPLPGPDDLAKALESFHRQWPGVLTAYEGQWLSLAAQLAGSSLDSLEAMLRVRVHRKAELTAGDVSELKRAIIERDAKDLIEFIESDRTLDDLHGQEALKEWLRQDIELWRQGDLQAMPMGYLICGPVGTGKTYMVECLSGEAGVPVVKLKNFRDRWVGSTEGNLEKIFRLLQALGRCVVFVDEADQTLGSRSGNSGDSGVSNRVYSMIAQQMSNTRNRGKILWVLASSRPDLIEVDLKRPGRVDVKIPIFPAATAEEGLALLRALCKRRGLTVTDEEAKGLLEKVPDLLTPGTAEALSVKAYRFHRTKQLGPLEAIVEALTDYRPAVDPVVMEFQIDLARKEASDLRFIPERFREPPLT